jgi:hypothetical protein
VARIYAGILGPLALVTSLAEGVIHARPAEGILLAAWCSLLVFASLGYVIGWIAERIVDEAVNAGIQARLARETPDVPPPTT